MFSDDRSLPQSNIPLDPCATVTELVPAHSIGATDEDEKAVLHAKLASCPETAAELARYSQLAEALLYSAPPVSAPPALAERLLAATQARSSTAGRGALQGAPPLNQPGASQPAGFSAVAPAAKRRWTFGGLAPSHFGLVAASLILLLLNGVFLVQNRGLQAQQADLAAQVAQQNRALILLSAEEPEEVELFDPNGVTAAQADILWNNSLGIGVLYVRAFPESQPNQAYQLWLNQGGEKTSGGLFRVDASGMGLLVFPIPQPLDAYDSIGITPEPQTGSPGPTAPPVVRGPV